jgi:predicted  nucleic acid-binding Zn-ribbon protein
MRDHLDQLEKEFDSLKQQRAENFREIGRLKDLNDSKGKEVLDKSERLKAMDYDLARTQARIEDAQKQIDARNYDLRNKQMILEDQVKEAQRLRDINGRIGADNSLLRKDVDKQMGEAFDLRKEVDYQQARNIDVANQLRDQDIRLKDKEEQAYMLRKDLDN